MENESLPTSHHATLTRADRLQKETKEVISTAAKDLLQTVAELQDTFATKIVPEGELDVAEQAAVLNIADSLYAALDTDIQLIAARPRMLRGDKDKVKLLPGQHPGILLEFAVPDSGEIIRVNVYGGLRGSSTQDLHDNDRTLANQHTRRTDAIASQKTEINVHMETPANHGVFDCWTVLSPNRQQFSLATTHYDGEKIDVHPVISTTDPTFEKLLSQFNTATETLIKLIPA